MGRDAPAPAPQPCLPCRCRACLHRRSPHPGRFVLRFNRCRPTNVVSKSACNQAMVRCGWVLEGP